MATRVAQLVDIARLVQPQNLTFLDPRIHLFRRNSRGNPDCGHFVRRRTCQGVKAVADEYVCGDFVEMERKKHDSRRAKVADVGTYSKHATAAGDFDHLVLTDVQWFGITRVDL